MASQSRLARISGFGGAVDSFLFLMTTASEAVLPLPLPTAAAIIRLCSLVSSVSPCLSWA